MSDLACQTVHGTCVASGESGLLILGKSGSGKSSLALSLLGQGATLVSDDRVLLTKVGSNVMAAPPSELRGLIEARGIGILKADVVEPIAVSIVVDMDQIETDRLPNLHEIALLDVPLPLLHRVDTPLFSVALLQFLKSGRHAPT